MNLLDFIEFNFISIIDIVLVAILMYQLYKLVRGTVAINIFIGLTSIYLLWKLVNALHMELLSEILGQFIGGGLIILVIVFQQELRKFLIMIGRAKLIKNKGFFKFNLSKEGGNLDVGTIIKACEDFSKDKTGALLVITHADDLAFFSESGVQIQAKISIPLLKSIFFKNSPLHDGAVIVNDNKIIAARCVLPVTNNTDFPAYLGMRHRAAVGISEESDAVVIIVSEQNGKISFAKEGELTLNCTIEKLEKLLLTYAKSIIA
ncbi:MAG: TIGR00159 family protein [Flavobacteriales bacterium]|nr:TIGR00159 family protein [Flavobacteriales bacterium]